jgi:acetyl-CoA synthetase
MVAMERGRHHNIADVVLDTHVRAGRGDAVALRSLAADGTVTQRTFADLTHDTARMASALGELGLRPGDRVFVLLGRGATLHATLLGILRAGMVAAPLFAAFGPEPVHQRIDLGEGRAIVTTLELYRRSVEPVRARLPGLTTVVLTDVAPHQEPPGTVALALLLADADPHLPPHPVHPTDPALVHFTSGTTGTPKGALHVHGAVAAHRDTAVEVFGLQPGEHYWCTADPGWVTGTSYGVMAPLAVGAVSIVDEAEFDPARWWHVLESEHVAVWYTAPTAIRMLRRSGGGPPASADLSALRLVASVGEPLDAGSVTWGAEVLGTPVRDTWWQTETGSIMIATTHTMTPRPGAMGQPLTGVTAGILACDDDGRLVHTADGAPLEIGAADTVGMLALRPDWPSMFHDYLGAHDRYLGCFTHGWYLTGDLVRRDADGFVWFVGRADDVITSAGHLIGPFEVEAVLATHPDVVAAGVYGVPDPDVGEVVHACVVARDPHADTQELVRSVRAHARRLLGAAVAPRRISVVDELPMTTSGKVMRRVLRDRDLAAVAAPGGTP